MSVNVFDKLEN